MDYKLAILLLNINTSTRLTKEDLKSALRTQAKLYHPDRPGGSEDRMKQINLAYELLLSHISRPEQPTKNYYRYEYQEVRPTHHNPKSSALADKYTQYLKSLFDKTLYETYFKRTSGYKNIRISIAYPYTLPFVGYIVTFETLACPKFRYMLKPSIDILGNRGKLVLELGSYGIVANSMKRLNMKSITIDGNNLDNTALNDPSVWFPKWAFD
jgi:curved DNA-binding protein CbpA